MKKIRNKNDEGLDHIQAIHSQDILALAENNVSSRLLLSVITPGC